MPITVVSTTANASTAPPTTWRCQARVRRRGSTAATDQHSSQPVSANVAGLRSDTGPLTAPPSRIIATTWTTIATSRTAPATTRTRGHDHAVRPGARTVVTGRPRGSAR